MPILIRKIVIVFWGFGVIIPAVGFAQARDVIFNVSMSAWPNNCDVPTGGQDSGTHLSIGPSISLTYGRVTLFGQYFTGNFDINPIDGLTRLSIGGADTVVYTDGEARRRGFTSNGKTKRTDIEIGIEYAFNRYARLSLALMVNRHIADIVTYWSAVYNNGNIILPSDPARLAPLKYTDNQFWLAEGFHGSVPVESISSGFSIFYNMRLLFIAGETGSGTATSPGGATFDVGPRATYTADAGGEITFPPRPLQKRSFGSNAGFAFSTGVGFEVMDSPAIQVFAGYNLKFFSEKEIELIDHSVFKGPYFGISYSSF